MRIGLKPGVAGPIVKRLHRVLKSAGFKIAKAEAERGTFGASTVRALRALQRQHHLRQVGEIDEPTLKVLRKVERNITPHIDHGGSSRLPAPDPLHGVVRGTLVDGDGAPIARTMVSLFAKQLRTETRLGDATTGPAGTYEISYRRTGSLNLVVRAYNAKRKLLAGSAVAFAAAADIEIDLTTAPDGIVRPPSSFTTIGSAVAARLHGTSLDVLREDKDHHDLQFLASAAGAPFHDVACFFIAHKLGAQHGLRPATLFALFSSGIPASLRAALDNIPDAGIADTFGAQVMSGVLAQSRSSLDRALSDAVAAGLVPASFASSQQAELSQLDALRTESVGSRPYIRGKTSLNDLLAAGAVAGPARAAFVQAYAENQGRLEPTWQALRSNANLSKADLDGLQTTLDVGEALNGNLPLVRDTLQRLLQGRLSGVHQLALLDEADWVARITEVDPEASSIPKALEDETPHQRIARVAKALAERLARRYPTTAFAGGLSRAKTSAFATRKELATFLKANPTLSFRRSNIDSFILTNKLTITAAALAELKTAQRLFRISPRYASVEALLSAGHHSAQSVYFRGRAPFIAQMTKANWSEPLARAAFNRAQAVYATALSAFGRFNLAFNRVSFAVTRSGVPESAAIANLPSLQALFGSLDFFQCADCRSVDSPAAYLVDLLQFLKQRATTGGTFTNARDVLIARRPDLQFIALSCDNTDVSLPYIDLVNEIFESVIAPPATPVTVIETTGTSAERRALPQQISQAAYTLTAGAVFPLSLPFDLPFAQTSAYLSALGSSRRAIMAIFRSDAGSSDAAIAGAALGVCPQMHAVIGGIDTHQPWERWGLAENPDWTAALAKVPALLNRAGLSLQQLYQLLEVVWVTRSGVTLQLGTVPFGGVEVLSSDLNDMTFTGLTADVLDRANRFLRLWTATGLSMWELDWALEHATGGVLDDAFLVFLAGAIDVRTRLALPFQEVLSFWGPLETRDVTSHLDKQDAVIPSTYSEVFRNPTILATWSAVFLAAQDLPGTPILFDPPAIPAQNANVNAITAALGLSADDISAVLAFTGAPNQLTLDTLNVLLRYARLGSALSLSIPDLILWIQLTTGGPFGGAPADTLEFIRRLGVLQATGIGIHDLDYLLRHQAAAQSSLAFTQSQATTVLQTIRDAIAKLAPVLQNDADAFQMIFIQALATATHVTANVVTPVLVRTGILPLDAATVGLLLAQDAGVDPAQFPQLVDAIVSVAKAARLFTALHPTEKEFAFLIQNAGSFGWLDPGALPVAPVTQSPYAAFEALLRALRLDRRQPARTPKLFDVFAQWLTPTGPPPDVETAISHDFAFALNSSAPDVIAVAAALHASTPSFNTGDLTGSLSDVALLSSIADALDIVAHYRTSGTTLVQLSAAAPTHDTAQAAMGLFQGQYQASAWFGAVQPVEDHLRQRRRDALVAYLLGPGFAATGSDVLTADDLFNYYLIDPEMSACAVTSRMLQAALTVQQFVQQCFLNLIPDVKIDAGSDPGWNEWSWRQQFRLWQNNRQVFLYPENYLLPELRTDKSELFSELESDLRQSDCDADSVTAAYESFLRKLVEISQLVVAAHYHEVRPDASRVLHVFAHTRGTPAKWFYRTRVEGQFGSGIWSAWQALNLDIHSDHLLPVVWDQRLHLVWAIFKQLSEKPKDQTVPAIPTSGEGTASAPLTFWAVEFAMSELSAGQWQAKKTIGEKMFFTGGYQSPLAYTFRAFQDPSFNLQLHAFKDVFAFPILGPKPGRLAPGSLVAKGTLLMPESPLAIVEGSSVYPSPGLNQIDTTQEPSYTLVTVTDFSHAAHITAPTGYGFSAQDLVKGGYFSSNPGTVPLNVLCQTTSQGQPGNVGLLATITNPRIVIPTQEPVFDSADPFFVADPSRVFFVQPHYYTVSSSPQELDTLSYVPQWSTRFAFSPFYHPFARTFLRELEIGGIDRLMRRHLQLDPESVRGRQPFNFETQYHPQPAIAASYPYPVEDAAFDVDGSYALYNWELFYHAPMFVASLLMQNQKHADAMRWLEYIFNPTDREIADPMDPNSATAPGHFWQTKPLHEMNATDWLAQQIQNMLTTLAADYQQGISDPAAGAAIADWIGHPFDPHRVARLRIGAYGKATVMKFLDTLVAWGDSLFAQYTMEMVSQAEQLYVFADLILGPKPDQMRLRDGDQTGSPDTMTYASIQPQLDGFSNALVEIENVVVAPAPSLQDAQGAAQPPSLPQLLLGSANAVFFCIPPNRQLLAYWDTVADRLYKIRHCLNLQGNAQRLPPYTASNPAPLVDPQASGAGAAGAQPLAPIYRFAVYLQRAVELTNEVRSYGSLILSALEKKDAEVLSALRANQDLHIQTLLLYVKNQQIAEAQYQITALQNQKAVVQIRSDFYSTISFLNEWEAHAFTLQGKALKWNELALVLDAAASLLHLVPSFSAGVNGAGGSPSVTSSAGGENYAGALASWASVARGAAGILSEGGGMSATIGSYHRRLDEWKLQAQMAAAELIQLDSQIGAANKRLMIATREKEVQATQISNAQVVSDFLTNRYTNEQLYDWTLTQLTTLHTQAYQLALGLALQAQAAFQYELGSQEAFVQFGYWDSQHKGLTAGESLLFDLRRMDARYLAENRRELELTKHVSLALTWPLALVQLIETGTCSLALDEALFDYDHPGHFFRRLRSVALTIPCVSGPYTGVNATLRLNTATVRVTPPVAPYQPALATTPPHTPSFVSSPAPATATIATSGGQDDAGLFDVNLRDERWLPFEGQGAISTWTLELDPRDNSFDFSTISDVVLHIRYTARSDGGDPEAVRTALKPVGTRRILVSVQHALGDAYYSFFHPADPNATQQTLTLQLSAAMFPFSNLGDPKISDIAVLIFLPGPPATGTVIASSFGPEGGAASALELVAAPGTTSAGIAIAALGGPVGLNAPTAPGTFTLTVPEGSVPASLSVMNNGHARLDAAKIVDIVLIINYAVE